MEDKFIEAFTGLERNFGVADLSQTKIDPTTGKARPVYKWTDNELTKKDFDVADVIRSGTDDIGFHVGTAAQATARGSTGKPYDRELMEGMTKGERILPMVLKQNLKHALKTH